MHRVQEVEYEEDWYNSREHTQYCNIRVLIVSSLSCAGQRGGNCIL